MTEKSKVRMVWPFAFSGQDSIDKKWFIKIGHSRKIVGCRTEDGAWKEMWAWMKEVLRRSIY